MSEPNALELDSLFVSYGGISAVKGLSLQVAPGEIVTLIGANGAGKSSTLKAIVGLVQPSGGTVRLFGEDVKDVPTHRLAGRGVALVPEGRAVFGNMSVLENLSLGAFLKREKQGFLRRQQRALELFPRLAERLQQSAGTLSGGEQQMLAIARALMSEPRLLLLDEPSLGLAPKLVAQIFEAIAEIAHSGITVVLVEQNTRLALETAHRAYVLITGELALSGACSELKTDPRVVDAYLGKSDAGAQGA